MAGLDPQLAVEKGLLATLNASSNLQGLVTAIKNSFAGDAARPYIVFSLNAGGDTNLQQRGQADLRYLVKCVGGSPESEGGARAAALAAQFIYDSLHEKTFTVDAPWKVYRVQRIGIVDVVEETDRKQIYHRGGIYRIRVSEDI